MAKSYAKNDDRQSFRLKYSEVISSSPSFFRIPMDAAEDQSVGQISIASKNFIYLDRILKVFDPYQAVGMKKI